MEDDLRTAIERLLNSFSAENESNTPDFILANFLYASLQAFDEAVRDRETWYDRDPDEGPGELGSRELSP